MNEERPRNSGEKEVEERAVGSLAAAAAHLAPAENEDELIERALARGTDRLFSCDSPLGEVYVGVSGRGVRSLGKADSAEDFARRYRERFGQVLSWSTDEATQRLATRVAAALAGETAGVPADLAGTTQFQCRVLEVVKSIPRGQVRPYAWVAREAGSPKASRAVGSVMAKNPVPLLVPCHRVVRNDGTTGSYAFGSAEKVGLLEAEGVPVRELAGAPYVATPTTGVFCHATCRNARRIEPENRRRFRTAAVAERAGYRPCMVCRPVAAATGS